MTRDTRIVAAVLASIAAAIAGAASLCSLAIAAGASAQWRLLFRVFCHGLPERSLAIVGEAMPICARCFGIYAGLLAGIACFTLLPSIRERTARMVLLVAALPIGVDGLTQLAGLRTSTNGLRIATGLAVAIAFALWALTAVENRDHDAVTAS